jgi:long-chain acyl-CoA synthetase
MPLLEVCSFPLTYFHMKFLIHSNLGLYHLGFCPEQNVDSVKYRFLGIIGKNREEWAIADFACMRSSITIVPFFESLGADAIAFVLNQTELTTICCEKKSLGQLIKLKKDGKIPLIKNLVCFDPADEATAKTASEAGVKTWSF